MNWKISEKWLQQHTSQDLVYHVVFESPAFTPEWWEGLCSNHEVDGGVILIGGANLKFFPELGRVSSCSGGEDALDSLDDAINDVLFTSIPSDVEVREVSAQRVAD